MIKKYVVKKLFGVLSLVFAVVMPAYADEQTALDKKATAEQKIAKMEERIKSALPSSMKGTAGEALIKRFKEASNSTPKEMVLAAAEGEGSMEGGKYFDADENPTYNIKEDGTVDWFTYSGYRKYHSECHVCHGPEGLGSSYAPALVESLKTMSYEDFQEVVINGREVITSAITSKMPALGTNKNVFCFLDDLYIYLKARSDGKLRRGRPKKKEPKTEEVREYLSECLGG